LGYLHRRKRLTASQSSFIPGANDDPLQGVKTVPLSPYDIYGNQEQVLIHSPLSRGADRGNEVPECPDHSWGLSLGEMTDLSECLIVSIAGNYTEEADPEIPIGEELHRRIYEY
jgi:hypothetical protein